MTSATETASPPADYFARNYSFNVVAEPEGGFVILFPDLPGCMTQVETIEDVPTAANEAKAVWMETELSEGRSIPPPAYRPV